MNRRKAASLMLVVGMIATLVVAVVGSASAQTAQGQLTAVNGASPDAVNVTADSVELASGLAFATAGSGVVVPGDGGYKVSFSDGSEGTVAVGPSTAFNVVSGYGDGEESAKGYEIEVSPISDGQAKFAVWNATAADVTVTVNGSSTDLAPGAGSALAETPPGDVTVAVGDVTETYSLAADNYLDVFVVNDGTSDSLASALVPSMTALIETLSGTEPPPEDPTVPDVAGLSAADANAALVDAGFDVAETTQASDDVAEGVAIGTEPAGGSTAPAGSTVRLIISSGPSTVEVPDVTGQPVEDAVAELEGLGFTTTTEEQASEDVEEGLVISTNPRAGTAVAPGSEVVVVVSTGPEDVVVPDFVGMTVEEANAAAEAAGLGVTFVEDPDDPDPEGLVVEQDPAAGEMVPAGSEVTLQLSPATQDPWTSIKVEDTGVLTAAGLNFLPESVSEAVVVDTGVGGKTVVDDDGFWIITLSMDPLDPNKAYEMLVTGTAEDGSPYEQTFKVPAVGEKVEEPVEEESIPTWVWLLLGVLVVAAITLGVVLVTNSSGATEAEAAESGAAAEGEGAGDTDAS
ncbi:MAG: PASTA domain-containing protein [Acidimicrobiia bacterium]